MNDGTLDLDVPTPRPAPLEYPAWMDTPDPQVTVTFDVGFEFDVDALEEIYSDHDDLPERITADEVLLVLKARYGRDIDRWMEEWNVMELLDVGISTHDRVTGERTFVQWN